MDLYMSSEHTQTSHHGQGLLLRWWPSALHQSLGTSRICARISDTTWSLLEPRGSEEALDEGLAG